MHLNNLKHLPVIVVLITASLCGYAQEETSKTYVTQTFRDGYLINTQTPEIETGFGFRMQHRFGSIGFDSTAINEFLGLDLPANIRFALTYPLIKGRMHVAIGRTKIDKVVDLETKFLLLKQTEKNEMPISVALYFNTGLNTNTKPLLANNAYFSDSTTEFTNKFAHRLDYITQVIIARKFGDKLSVMLSPTLIYENLTKIDRENMTYALSGGMKFSYKQKCVYFY